MTKHGLRYTPEQYAALTAKGPTAQQLANREQKFAPKQIWSRDANGQQAVLQTAVPGSIPGRDAIRLSIPWPPTTNTYIRHAGKDHYMTPPARAWYRKVIAQCLESRIQPIVGRLSVTMTLYPPNARRIDIDNRIKSALDALQHGGCYADDAAIDKLIVERGPVVKGGRCDVVVEGI